MRVVALASTADHVSLRYRVLAFQDELRLAGYDLSIMEIPKSLWGRIVLSRSVRGADAVIVQRKLLSRWEVDALRRAVPKLIFDFDDAVWMRDSYAGGRTSAKRLRRFRHIVRTADAVVAGNHFLAEYAERVGATARWIVPTCIDPARYPQAAHVRRDAVSLVWIGSSSTLKGMERNRGLFEYVAQRVPSARLRVVCDRFPQWNRMPVTALPWSRETEGTDLAESDVGVSWIPDDDWSRGKCGLKLLQYMAAGLPVVANPVGVHREIVVDGLNGILAETPAQWADAVNTLRNDPEMRRRMGDQGRRLVEERYSVRCGGREWVNLLHHRA